MPDKINPLIERIFHEIIARPLAQRDEPYYLVKQDWLEAEQQLRERCKREGRKFLCLDSAFPNFLVAGVEVRAK